jgi:hypothetical protein
VGFECAISARFNILKQVVNIITTGFKGLITLKITTDYTEYLTPVVMDLDAKQ